ncbi:hypothetical protein GGI20_003115 [Coemansia sp. BCRC 34301]|nr:hypothetical protein GGI20_003115 [Coemansia sp. BCRC 34301]
MLTCSAFVEAAQSPLGILAALASPSPPIRNAPHLLAASMPTIAGNDSTPKPVHSSLTRPDMANTPSIDAGASDMCTPKLESRFPERAQRPASRSASPPYSPSTRAAKRKSLKNPHTPGNDFAVKDSACGTVNTLAQSDSALGSVAIAPTRSPVRSGAPLATQLDVLALVTATSPPMPSRRKWTGQGSITPVNGLRETLMRRPEKAKGEGGSSSDTVSEDEDQLRSHSSRLKARYQSVRLRTLPETPPVASSGEMSNRGARSHYTTRTYPAFYAHGQRLSLATPGRVQAGNTARAVGEVRVERTSDCESTTTDDEAFVQTPAMRRAPVVNVGFASEPSIRRQERQRLNARPLGASLSKQLSELAEETEETDTGETHVIHQLRDLSASLSPLSSPTRRHPRTRRKRARTNTQRPGSETETDNESEYLAQRNDPSASLAQQRRIIARSQHNGSATHYRPLVTNGSNGHVSAHATQQSRLLPMAYPGGALTPRRGAVRPPPPCPPRAQGGGESGGDTTETDDDCFDTSRSFHYSIRPPRRMVRQLASLRSRNLPPAALDLHSQSRQHLPAPTYQPHTAPVVGSSSGANDAFGLGISSIGAQRGSGPYAGPARIVSTPMPAPATAIVHTARDRRHNAPAGPIQDFSEASGPPPARLPPAEHRAYPMHNSSMRREFARDPFAPMPDEFTYKGAALRRLERSHNRGVSGGGDGLESLASRKRALTAPSSLEPPLPKLSMRGTGASSPETPSEQTPHVEPRHPIGNRPSLLGESPVSSLRSSLFARAAPSLPTSLVHSSASSSSSSLSGVARSSASGDPRHGLADILEPTALEHNLDPAVSSRKRRHSSAAARHELQIPPPDNTPPYVVKAIEASPASSPLDRTSGRSPQSSDALFPPIDSGSN